MNEWLTLYDKYWLNLNERYRAAEYFRSAVNLALRKFENILLLTHVPPFKDACRYGDGISDDFYLPHFGCMAVGEILIRIMRDHPKHNMTVLCGHTHGSGETQILPNLLVKTGGARYRYPQIQEILTVK